MLDSLDQYIYWINFSSNNNRIKHTITLYPRDILYLSRIFLHTYYFSYKCTRRFAVSIHFPSSYLLRNYSLFYNKEREKNTDVRYYRSFDLKPFVEKSSPEQLIKSIIESIIESIISTCSKEKKPQAAQLLVSYRKIIRATILKSTHCRNWITGN